MTNYQKQAEDFLAKHGATITIKLDSYGKHFEDDKENRNLYAVTITRGEKSFSLRFGDSLNNTREYRIAVQQRNMSKAKKHMPNAYDILACLQKYETPSDVFEFAEEFGYTVSSRTEYRKVDRIAEACEKEYKNVRWLFGDCLEELQDIN